MGTTPRDRRHPHMPRLPHGVRRVADTQEAVGGPRARTARGTAAGVRLCGHAAQRDARGGGGAAVSGGRERHVHAAHDEQRDV